MGKKMTKPSTLHLKEIHLAFLYWWGIPPAEKKKSMPVTNA
jgi:hypothetical protein